MKVACFKAGLSAYRHFLIICFGLCFSLFSTACGNSYDGITVTRNQTGTTLENTVAAVKNFPASGSKDIPVNTDIYIKFSGPIDLNSVDNFRFRVENEFGVPIEGRFTPNSDKTELHFTPTYSSDTQVLKPSTLYAVKSRYLRDGDRQLVTPYAFSFRTQGEVQSTGKFKIVDIQPGGTVLFPSNRISVEFNEQIQRPPSGNRCDQGYWANTFQIIVTRFFSSDGNTQVYPVSGQVCLQNGSHGGNDDTLVFTPDSNFPIFPETSIVDIRIVPSPNLTGVLSGEGLKDTKHITKIIAPDPKTIFDVIFGIGS